MQLNKAKYILLILLVVVANKLFAQTTTIPADAKSRTSPFLFTPETIKNGEQIYQINCKSCHGDPGKETNNKQMNPVPKDPASSEYQKNSDGEMFYILSNGRGLMPNFSNILNEEQRWVVISFIRSFNKEYKQPPVKTAGEAVKTETAKMVLSYDSNKKLVIATITDSTAGKRKPLANVSIKLFVKRTFGNLFLAEVSTGNEGVAYFNPPSDIPGDSLGTLSLIAKTQGNSKELTGTLIEKLGVKTKAKILLAERSWWNISSMAPVWLIILYSSGVAAVGLILIYILLQLRKIKQLNKKTTETQIP
jgi:mono/diheme cytochrome c family protein